MVKDNASRTRHVHHVLEGASLETMVSQAMEILAAAGVVYPEGYKNVLVAKYKQQGISYPRILQRIGNPNIRKHFRYQEILQQPGDLLDYGCGTGDDLRALIHDGFPRDKITGYDINTHSIDLGFDLYLDQAIMNDLFIASRNFPFSPGSFDIIYSGSVIHALGDSKGIAKYITNAINVLRSQGIFFGSTLGHDEFHPGDPDHALTLLTQPKFHDMLIASGFVSIDIRPAEQEHDDHLRFWFYAEKV